MRLVYEQAKEKDGTPGQKVLRQLFEESPRDFINQLRQAEREYQARGRAAQSARQAARQLGPAPVEGKPDQGQERVEELILRLLDQTGESAQVGSRLADSWDGLSDGDRQAILDILDAAPTNARLASRRAHP
jgi:hypothetical protein